jgi:hypothetical protein
MGTTMSSVKFLTPEEVSERYRGHVTVGTLRNWRSMRTGPAFVKIGKAVLYPVDELDKWDRQNLIMCASPSMRRNDNEVEFQSDARNKRPV